MATLFLAHRIPYPPDRGDKIRSWHMLRHIATLGPVDLACFADDAADAAHLPALREVLGGALGEAHVEIRTAGKAKAVLCALATGAPASVVAFRSASLQAFVDRRPPGPIFVFSGQMAQFVPPGRAFVMDFADMDSAKFADYAAKGGLLAPLHAREAKRLFAFERATAARATASLFVSEAEADLFRAAAKLPDADIRAVGNGIDLDFYDPSTSPVDWGGQGPMIAFTGQMDYPPNVEAVTGFARDVLPAVPHATFAIVGRKPTAAVNALASERVIVTGGVPDVRPWLAAADVVVAPLGIARGIQNKVLEAMAMARPVVASPQAFEGIEAEPGRDLIVADGAAAQGEAIRALLADRARATAIGAAARRRMEEGYRWDWRLAPLAGLLGAT